MEVVKEGDDILIAILSPPDASSIKMGTCEYNAHQLHIDRLHVIITWLKQLLL